jgi:hypothetical protein
MELEPNRKLFHDHLPSILHGALVGTGSLWCLFPLLLRTIVAPSLWFVHIGPFASTGQWTPVSGPGRLGLVCNVFICTHMHIWLLFGWKKWRNQDLSSLSYESIHMSPSFIAYFILIMSVPTPNYTWKLRRVLSCYTLYI